MVLQNKYWIYIKGACYIVVACVMALVKLMSKYFLGIYQHFKNPYDAQRKIYKTVEDIPGPRSFPILGTRWIYWKFGLYKLNAVQLAYKDMFNRYGDIICKEALSNLPVVSIKNRDIIKIVLRHSGNIRPLNEVTADYRKSRPDRYTNTGLANEQGEVWASLRNELTKKLTCPKVIRSILPDVNHLADDFIDLISQARDADNGVIKFGLYCNRMGLESMYDQCRRFVFLDDVVSETAKRLSDSVTRQFPASQEAFYGFPFWKIIPTKAYKEFVAREDTLNEQVQLVEKLRSE